jgi:subtilisin family serine protease
MLFSDAGEGSLQRVFRTLAHRVYGGALLAAALVSGGLMAVDSAPAATVTDSAAHDAARGYASTHILVRVKPGHAPARLADGRWTIRATARASARLSGDASDLARASQRWRIASMAPAMDPPPANRALAAALGLDRYYIVRVPAETDTWSMARDVRRFTSIIESVELDVIGGTAAAPNDSGFTLQYGMNNTGQTGGFADADVDAPEAWDISQGSSSVLIAVLDAGLDNHSELAGRIVPGWNTVSGNTDTGDVCSSHGTHVTGIAAAKGDNGQGVAGMNWLARIMPIRVLNSCFGTSTATANGVVYATDQNARVINMSLQFYFNLGNPSDVAAMEFFQNAVLYAHNSGVVMVAATGNNHVPPDVAYPAYFAETIAVAATNHFDQRASFSNAGPQVDVAAPGDDIWSLIGTSNYGYKEGTSMAAPHVSGLVALMLGVDPTLTPAEVRDILQGTSDDVMTPGFDQETGYGRVNARRALQEVVKQLGPPGDITDDGVVDIADLLELLANWGPCPEIGPCPADLDENGFVDIADLLLLLGYWG